ncbi:MAG: hypothetical protein TREMPRED_004537 [Tremellales sp. Tagirdzhanova-0007]|nr:MAG: hypothetical protein TREMPRED_004537 [Tremellales sp. Tagirdzhanova-0007]
MDDHPDPLLQFFSATEFQSSDILYTTLELQSTCSADEIKRAYRKAALRLHPDKHATKSDTVRQEMSKEFQKVGFAYAVLGDEVKRKRYDATGRTDDLPFADAESMGWDAYFESMYQRFDRKVLDEDKARYQGSQEELVDLVTAYNSASGSFPRIVQSIPHSQITDESRFITSINELISDGKLSSTKKWTTTSTDDKARAGRVKAAERAAKEAEKAAEELGIWDEFYGSGHKGVRKGKGTGKGKENDGDNGDGLAAIILKRQREREGGLDALEEKYRRLEEEERQRKRTKGKRGKVVAEEDGPVLDISEADFEALQANMFPNDEAGKKPRKVRKTKA